MRRLLSTIALAALLWGARDAVADGDPHAEMAAALAAQIDAHPAPPVVPGKTAATRVASTPAARHVPPQADLGRRAAEQAQDAHDQTMSTLVHQAQAAALAAAGQAQAAAARLRHNPHR